MKTSRELCLTALLRMEKDEAYSNIVLNALLEKCALGREEKSFATRIFYGVLEKKLILDFNISQLLSKPIHKLDTEILAILRMGMYQLLFMDSVPDSAAVNESVKLCYFTKKISAKGLVNAILRNKLRENKEIKIPKALNEALSCDKSIAKLLCEQYSEDEAKEIFAAFSSDTKQYIKINAKKISFSELANLLKEKGIEIVEHPTISNCAEVISSGDVAHTDEFKNGLFFIQDLASQICVDSLFAQNAERVLDVCAAPGSKTFSISISAPDSAEIVSCDVSENRVSLIEKGRERLGLSNVKATVNDATVFNERLGQFDRVLCDVPCSGLGVIGKKPEIRYKKIDPDALFSIQYKILETSSRYLKSGGILVYSTCTLNKRENEAVIEKFLSEHSDFAPHPLKISEQNDYKITLLPHKDNCDGFFISAITKI